ATQDLRARTERLDAAVHAGMDRAKAFVIGKNGRPERPLSTWMKGSVEDLDEALTTMGFAAGALPARSTLIIAPPDGDDEAGLAARAAAAGMDIDTRRAAEANQRRSAAQEHAR